MSGGGLRDSLRLAATVTVVNGFTHLFDGDFGYYASMAVLSVSVGTYGNTLELGRQRLIGTAVGAVVVVVGYRAWGDLPVVVALPLALLLARLIAGSLRLSVGYSVCCFMVVMGWLSHEQELFGWIQLRLVWTAFGILMALLSLRLLWPARARIQQRQGLQQLLRAVAQTLESAATGRTPTQEHPQRWLEGELRQLRRSLLSLRDQRQGALLELGTLASQHPHARLWALLDQACEQLILDLDDLRRLPPADWHGWGLDEIRHAGKVFLQAASLRVLQWQGLLARTTVLSGPPAADPPTLALAAVPNAAVEQSCRQLNAEQLTRVSTYLMALSRMQQTLESSEGQWRELRQQG
jgi:uncharacterized membrane protein YccC